MNTLNPNKMKPNQDENKSDFHLMLEELDSLDEKLDIPEEDNFFDCDGFDPDAADPFAPFHFDDSETDDSLYNGLPNFFQTTDESGYGKAEKKRVKLTEELHQLLKDKDYPAFLKKFKTLVNLSRKWSALAWYQQLDYLGLRLPMEDMKEMFKLGSFTFAFSDHPYAHGDIERKMYIQRCFEEDNQERLAWYLAKAKPSDDILTFLLDDALKLSAVDCVKWLLTLKKEWVMTTDIAVHWACHNSGNPALNACIHEIAMTMLPESMKNPLAPPNSLPYHPQLTIEYLKSNIYGTKSEIIEFLAMTPFMVHAVSSNMLTSRDLNSLVLELERYTLDYMGSDIPYPYHEGDELRDYSNDFGIFSRYNFLKPHGSFQQVISLILLLVEKHPSLLKQKATRSLITVLALCHKPDPNILELAKNLSGKQLIINNVNFPWFHWQYSTPLVEDCLFAHWEERMPANLRPFLPYGQCPNLGDDVVKWLDHCQLSGSPSQAELSGLAKSFLSLPCDHISYLDAHKEGGILETEKKQYIDYLRREKAHFRSHYLISISLLKEEKDYGL